MAEAGLWFTEVTDYRHTRETCSTFYQPGDAVQGFHPH